MKNTALCYIEKDGKYLMLHRNKKTCDENKDKWIGIGGKFNDKESPEDCAVREVYEETGLTLLSLKYRAIITFVSDEYETEYMHLFTSDCFTGNISECDEGTLEWIDKERLYSLTLWEGDKIFLDKIRDDSPFFSLKLCYNRDNLTQAYLDRKRIR